MATYEMRLVQNERFLRAFRYSIGGVAVVLTGYEWSCQIRQKEQVDADLILNLEPYLELDGTDPSLLKLSVPATITRVLPKFRASASWDLFLWPAGHPEDAICLIQGPASLDPATSA